MITAIFSYEAFQPNPGFDDLLISFMENLEHEFVGAGCGLGGRDVEFEFDTQEEAEALLDKVKTMATLHNVEGITLVCEER
jgi:hypothetical protein